MNKIRIDGFDDFETLQSKGIVVVNPKSKVDYICPSGQEFTSLQITGDGLIDNMVAGARILGNSRVDYCSVSTSPKRDDGTKRSMLHRRRVYSPSDALTRASE